MYVVVTGLFTMVVRLPHVCPGVLVHFLCIDSWWTLTSQVLHSGVLLVTGDDPRRVPVKNEPKQLILRVILWAVKMTPKNQRG